MAQAVLAEHKAEMAQQGLGGARSAASLNQPAGGALASNVRNGQRRNLNGLVISWYEIPPNPAVSGTLWDPDNTIAQDWGLNSSILVQVTRDGQPVRGVSVTWATTDSTAKVQAGMPTTDTDGTARAWYWVGSASSQTITAKIAGTAQSITTIVAPQANPDPRQLAYPTAYMGMFDFQPDQTSANISTITPLSDVPYSQFVVNHHGQDWGHGQGYGSQFGLQLSSDDCSALWFIDSCSKSRGRARGHVATLAAWPAINDPGNPTVAYNPVVVSTGPKTQCNNWDMDPNLGSTWSYCASLVDWKVGTKSTFKTEDIGGAATGWQRVRTSVVHADGSTTEIATIDVPGGINFGTSFFGTMGPYSQDGMCLNSKRSAMTINSNQVLLNGAWTDVTKGSAGINDWNQDGCQNFQTTVDDGQITLATGGSQWMDMEPVLHYDPSVKYMHFGKGYYWLNGPMWQAINIDLTKRG